MRKGVKKQFWLTKEEAAELKEDDVNEKGS